MLDSKIQSKNGYKGYSAVQCLCSMNKGLVKDSGEMMSQTNESINVMRQQSTGCSQKSEF